MSSPPESVPRLALVIDSHPTVGAVVLRMLAHAGIDAGVAHGSQDAEPILDERVGEVRLVVAKVDGAHDCCAALLRPAGRRTISSARCVTANGAGGDIGIWIITFDNSPSNRV